MEDKKFNLVEIFGLMAWAVFADFVGVILILLALNDFGILEILNLLPLGYLMTFKRLSFAEARPFVIGIGLELIPGLDAFPIYTAAMAINLWRVNHPESAVAKIAEKAARAIPIKRPAATAMPAKAPGIKTPIGGLTKS